MTTSEYPIIRHIPTDAEHIYLYRCGLCAQTATVGYRGLHFMAPGDPGEGWREVGGSWVCPAHELEIRADGRPILHVGRADGLRLEDGAVMFEAPDGDTARFYPAAYALLGAFLGREVVGFEVECTNIGGATYWFRVKK